MTAARTGDLVAAAQGVVAFNVITLEHAEGILLGAERADRPVVLQVSENAIRYHSGGAPLLSACASLVATHPRPRRCTSTTSPTPRCSTSRCRSSASAR